MTSILLIIVGIALAAAAALMVVFYGGSAFDTGSVKARANTLENAALSVTSAARLYLVEKSDTPADMRALISSRYLSQKPEVDGDGIGVQSESWRRLGTDLDGNGGRLAYVVDDVPGEVCLAILHIHRQDDTAIPSGPTTSPSGCFQANSGTDAVFYAYLPTDGSGPEADLPPPTQGSRPAPVDPAAAAASIRQIGTMVASAGRSFMLATGRMPSSDADLSPDYVTRMPRSESGAAGEWSYRTAGRTAMYLSLIHI